MQEIQTDGLEHVRMHDYLSPMVRHGSPDLIAYIQNVMSIFEDDTISINLMYFYNDLAVSTNSTQNLSTVNVSKLYLFNGNPDDVILGIADQTRILNSTPQIPVSNKTGYNYSGLLRANHAGLTANKNVTDTITELIK